MKNEANVDLRREFLGRNSVLILACSAGARLGNKQQTRNWNYTAIVIYQP